MLDRKLSVPAGYDPAVNPRVSSFAAQLDDQLRRLKADLEGYEVRHLEWQPQPGVNTTGMLLAHLAVVDVWWLDIAPRELEEAAADKTFLDVIGMGGDDDGLPLPPDGRHPATLAGKRLEDYFRILDRARESAHGRLRGWKDAEIEGTYKLRDRLVSREWTAYHVLEHLAAHYGQILLLRHLMRDAGLLPRP